MWQWVSESSKTENRRKPAMLPIDQMKPPLLEIGETLTALAVIVVVILAGIAGITLCMKIIGSLLGAH